MPKIFSDQFLLLIFPLLAQGSVQQGIKFHSLVFEGTFFSKKSRKLCPCENK